MVLILILAAVVGMFVFLVRSRAKSWHLDEKVAKLHLERMGVELEELREDQASYIGVTVEGPYKPDYYRY